MGQFFLGLYEFGVDVQIKIMPAFMGILCVFFNKNSLAVFLFGQRKTQLFIRQIILVFRFCQIRFMPFFKSEILQFILCQIGFALLFEDLDFD